MVRSGQMVLAQALMNLFESSTSLYTSCSPLLTLVSLAGLDADRKSPYSTYRQVI